MKSYALIIMKPDALERELVEAIIKRFKNAGFQLEMMGYRKVNRDLILKHYEEVIGRFGDTFKDAVIDSFVGKEMIPIVLSQEGNDAIINSRALTGSTDPSQSQAGTIRGDFGIDTMEAANRENRCCFNLLHCSDSEESLENEIKI